MGTACAIPCAKPVDNPHRYPTSNGALRSHQVTADRTVVVESSSGRWLGGACLTGVEVLGLLVAGLLLLVVGFLDLLGR